MKAPRFEVYQSKAQHGIGGTARNEWRWRLKAANGRIIAQGEGHTRKADAERALATVVRTAKAFDL